VRYVVFFNLLLIPYLLSAAGDKVACNGRDKEGAAIIQSYSKLAFGLARDRFYTHSLVKLGRKYEKMYIIKLVGNNCFCSNNQYRYNPKSKIKYNLNFIFSAGEILCKELLSSDKALGTEFDQGDINLITNNAFDFLTTVCVDACEKSLDKQKTGKYLCTVNDTVGKSDWSCRRQ